ncbi:DUF6027 family protein [Egicoccus sp. AB-alg2]|uniref:DUF6027 family protein n=1 Tax=Egicoccus sp. AB-alg2 TaxID=3242693 RepID=UPI00359CEB84
MADERRTGAEASDDRTDGGEVAADGPAAPTVRLERWDGPAGDDAFAGLRADVAAYGHLDPLVTVRGLSEVSGLPVGALVRYVLARWAAGGNEAVLELGVSGVDHLARLVARAEQAGDDRARLSAYHGMREVVAWLRAGVEAAADEGAADEDASPT